ncbi:ATP-binding protein [Actinacidiphila oryziradicis]|uniref:ATP-binding protein n=1 Tax=Actinacidiphila oryziradicis TaxID=2571141 RepID=A0A4U0SQ67_9ACTN|nr:ATP-binding protein [Actinacidiphila oryziradicis]TKA12076.1 ATP-binding protein [Actinacidiphila oryziradicis]
MYRNHPPASVLEATTVGSPVATGPRQAMAVHIASDLQHVARVRAAVRSALRRWRVPQLTDDLVLMADELVANAIRYSGSSGVEVRLQVEDGIALLEVDDGADTEPVVRQASKVDEDGRGLFLVDALSDTWGSRSKEGGGKTVWATLAVPVAGAA